MSDKKLLKCQYCGQDFIGVRRQKYCSAECKRDAATALRHIKSGGPMSKYTRSSKLTQHIMDARAEGISYAEWQMRETLAMIPRVDPEV